MAVAWTEVSWPEAVHWYVAALRSAPDEASVTRAAERFRLGAHVLKLALQQRRDVFGGFTPREVEGGEEGLLVLTGMNANGRTCTVRLRVDRDCPHAIRSHAIYVTPAPGYVIREGVPEDLAACADVESRTPMLHAALLRSDGDRA